MSVARTEAKSPVQADAVGVRLTEAQLRRRRARSIAIGLALGALAIVYLTPVGITTTEIEETVVAAPK